MRSSSLSISVPNDEKKTPEKFYVTDPVKYIPPSDREITKNAVYLEKVDNVGGETGGEAEAWFSENGKNHRIVISTVSEISKKHFRESVFGKVEGLQRPTLFQRGSVTDLDFTMFWESFFPKQIFM